MDTSHPPFEPGNVAALRHGAFSERSWAPLAEKLRTAVLESDVAPWLGEPMFAATVEAWARVEAQAALVAAYVEKHGLLDDDGSPRPATDLQTKLDRQAHLLRQELGITPMALMKLMGGIAGVLGSEGRSDAAQAVRERGARVLEARRAQLDAPKEATA